MTVDPLEPNAIKAAVGRRSVRAGDVPEGLRRRYYVDGHGGPGLGFYVDATIARPAFRDRGDRLTSARSDPDAIRHMAAIARHHGWTIVVVQGDPGFRREAWLAARTLGLEARGYRAAARDLQELERRVAARERRERHPAAGTAHAAAPARRDRELDQAGPRSRLKVVETVVRARVAEPAEQARILAAARERLARWLERGARVDELPMRDRQAEPRERSRHR